MANFIDSLIDWQDFEKFIRDIYELDPDMVVKHNVILEGKSGAKRQIDVLLTHKSKLHTYVTVVECKRWKEKVDRGIIDILYATIEDINASKGVIFTTSGYEEGAQQYALSKNIDIFIVRELKSQEWGLPGRIIDFYMHVIAGNIGQIALNAAMIPLVEKYPEHLSLDIVIGDDKPLDDNLYLYSVVDGDKGMHLINLLQQNQNELMQTICSNIPIIGTNEDDATLVITSDVELNFENYEYRQLRLQYGVININKIIGKFVVHITQSRFHFDKAEDLDIALVVENYIRKQMHIVFKKGVNTNLSMSDDLYDKLVKEKIANEEVLENGSILKVYLDPHIKICLKGNEKTARTTEKIILHMK